MFQWQLKAGKGNLSFSLRNYLPGFSLQSFFLWSRTAPKNVGQKTWREEEVELQEGQEERQTDFNTFFSPGLPPSGKGGAVYFSRSTCLEMQWRKGQFY